MMWAPFYRTFVLSTLPEAVIHKLENVVSLSSINEEHIVYYMTNLDWKMTEADSQNKRFLAKI